MSSNQWDIRGGPLFQGKTTIIGVNKSGQTMS